MSIQPQVVKCKFELIKIMQYIILLHSCRIYLGLAKEIIKFNKRKRIIFCLLFLKKKKVFGVDAI